MKMDSRIKNVNEVYTPYNIYKDNDNDNNEFGYFPKTHYAIADLNLSEYGKFIGFNDGEYRYVTKDGKVDSSQYYIPESNLK